MAILSNTDRAGAHIMAKRISDSAHDLVLMEDNKDVQKLTLSVGMAVLTGTDSSTSLIDRAGKALSNAKKRGGNLIHS
jgi:GGDEF domain-containing protein